jgi:hypothetical protein
MTEDDQRCLIAALRAVQNLCLQNEALQRILIQFKVPDWKSLSDQLLTSPEFWPDVRAQFAQAIDRLEHTPPDSVDVKLIQGLLSKLPVQGKPN